MKIRFLWLIWLFLLTIPQADSSAQPGTRTIITGRITDAQTAEPLENVNVFLSNTTIGNSSGKDGTFSISGAPIGVFDLVFSRIGYQPRTLSVRILKSDSLYYEIQLQPKVLQSSTVEIVGEAPREWQKNLKMFAKAFIGETAHSDRCAMLNPEILNFRFDEKADTLVASADNILHVDNLAFGYRIHIVLVQFVWNVGLDVGHYLIYPFFEELKPRTPNQFSEWQENRRKSFDGSLKQFLHGLYAGTIDEDDVAIFAGPVSVLQQGGEGHRVDPGELVTTSDNDTLFKKLIFPEYLRVDCGKVSRPDWRAGDWTSRPSSMNLITLRDSVALIDSAGNLINPLSLEISGTWARNRVAELLPMY